MTNDFISKLFENNIIWIPIILILILVIYLIVRERKANIKREKIEKLREQITAIIPVSAQENIKANSKGDVNIPKSKKDKDYDAAFWGAGITGISLFQLYIQSSNRQEILDVLDRRFPQKAESMESFSEWINDVGPEGIIGLESGYKGQVAEDLSKDLLEAMGYDVSVPDSLTNPSTDLFSVDSSGNSYEWSVKNGEPEYVLNEIRNSDADHFIINEESYDYLDNKGLIDDYSNQGIEILNGGFDQGTIENAFDQALEDIDVFDTVPFVALALFARKAVKNTVLFKNGQQTGRDYGINLLADAGSTAVKAPVVALGSSIGAVVGDLIFPGVGAIVGVGVGAVASSKIVSNITEKAKNKFKWGKIIKAQQYFGKKFLEEGNSRFVTFVIDTLFDKSSLERNCNLEYPNFASKINELNPYSPEEPTLAAVLAQEAYVFYKNNLYQVEQTEQVFATNLIHEINVTTSSLKISEVKKANRGLLGEIILQVGNKRICDNDWEELLCEEYNEKVDSCEDYPYNCAFDTMQFVKSVAFKAFNNVKPCFTVDSAYKELLVD